MPNDDVNDDLKLTKAQSVPGAKDKTGGLSKPHPLVPPKTHYSGMASVGIDHPYGWIEQPGQKPWTVSDIQASLANTTLKNIIEIQNPPPHPTHEYHLTITCLDGSANLQVTGENSTPGKPIHLVAGDSIAVTINIKPVLLP